MFHGADTQLTNAKLGVAGTKAARAASGGGRGRYHSSRGGRGGNRQGYQSRQNNDGSVLTGWKKLAASHGICFKFSEGSPCDQNCLFKHQCLYCDSTAHNMGSCKRGDNKA